MKMMLMIMTTMTMVMVLMILSVFVVISGDDAVGVEWKDIDRSLKLYASHSEFIRLTADRHGAHW